LENNLFLSLPNSMSNLLIKTSDIETLLRYSS